MALTIDELSDLYCNFHTAIFGFIRRRVLTAGDSPELAEDMTHETFRRAFESIRSGAIVEHPSAWLFRIARNLIIDHYRHKAHDAPPVHWEDAWDEPSSEPSPHDLAVGAITCETIDRCLRVMDPLHVQVISLMAEGYRGVELGEATGRNVDAGKQVLVRARRRLRDMMQGMGD